MKGGNQINSNLNSPSFSTIQAIFSPVFSQTCLPLWIAKNHARRSSEDYVSRVSASCRGKCCLDLRRTENEIIAVGGLASFARC
jgi:hypothetical protein